MLSPGTIHLTRITNSREGVEYMAQLACDAGFQKMEIVETDGKPGVGKVIMGRGYGDIEVNVSGGYDRTSTDVNRTSTTSSSR